MTSTDYPRKHPSGTAFPVRVVVDAGEDPAVTGCGPPPTTDRARDPPTPLDGLNKDEAIAGGVAEIFTLAVPGLRAVIIQVVVPGAPTRTEAEGVYSPLLTLMAFFFPVVDATGWHTDSGSFPVRSAVRCPCPR